MVAPLDGVRAGAAAGQHTHEVLRALGFSDKELERLVEKGVFG